MSICPEMVPQIPRAQFLSPNFAVPSARTPSPAMRNGTGCEVWDFATAGVEWSPVTMMMSGFIAMTWMAPSGTRIEPTAIGWRNARTTQPARGPLFGASPKLAAAVLFRAKFGSVGVSAGVHEGPARVARTFEEARALQAGEVLVVSVDGALKKVVTRVVNQSGYISLSPFLTSFSGSCPMHGISMCPGLQLRAPTQTHPLLNVVGQARP